ncbi:MAG TPA: adenylate/guanylate cyclase domain-containing protein [Burkholderiales bacterium]|nr:adenylate/guanylate cyclase domain-containing protein [Burkholderiales bacterium]
MSGAGAARFAAPEAYTPKHLAERILTSRAAIEGERKQVTVLFADLKGSMELLADRDPEEARRLLDPVLERMMEAVHRYEGTVNQVMGDGIMALFGAPLAHEDHAIRACYAALRIQESVKKYAEELRRSAGVPVLVRVGLNSGEVVVRSIRSDLHMDYTAVGQTTHLAARMEQAAVPGSILLTAETLQLAEGYVTVKPLGPVTVKGLIEPVEVYELTGASTARTRLRASAAHGLTRFVGRDAEIELLRRALEKTARGQGQIVAVVGEPGVGKSRLFFEFTHSHRAHGWLCLGAGSVSYGKATAYLPVIDLLKEYFQIEERDDVRKVREKVVGKLFALDEALKPALAALLALLEVPVEDDQWLALDPPRRRQQTLQAVKHLLLRESRVQPLQVVFEDLHWIDSETQAFLDGLVESLPTARLLLLVNYRPEYQHGWGGKTYYTQLRIDPLPPEDARGLLRALLGNDPSVQPLAPLLIERTEGNPFFLEESVRALVEGKALAGERGAYRLARPLQAIQVPATVQTILAARIDRLSPDEKSLLQTASVIGKDIPFRLLETLVGLPEDALRQKLAHLQAAEFLYETRLFPDLEYTFKHALTHEVTYGSLLFDRRRTLHSRITDAIEELYQDRWVEQVERLAYHAVRGEAWEKAVHYLGEAGNKAQERSSLRESLSCFEQGLAGLKHLPETRETLERAVDLRISLRKTLMILGELARVRETLLEAHALAKNLGDERRIAWVSALLAHNFWLAGDPDRAIELNEAALATADAVGDADLRFAAAAGSGPAHYQRGEYRRGRDVLSGAVKALEGFTPSVSPLGSLTVLPWYLAWCLAELGEFRDAIARGEETLRLSEAIGRPLSIVHACLGVGGVYLRKGDLDKAIPALDRAYCVCREWSLELNRPGAAALLGLTYALAGRVGEGLPLLETAVEQDAAKGLMRSHALTVAWLGEAYLLAARIDEAAALAERALRLSRVHKERGHEAWVLRLLGEIAFRRNRAEGAEAEGRYGEALAVAEELGMRPLVAHCHLALGMVCRQRRKRQDAQGRLTTAAALYREMEMQLWLKQAQTEMEMLA